MPALYGHGHGYTSTNKWLRSTPVTKDVKHIYRDTPYKIHIYRMRSTLKHLILFVVGHKAQSARLTSNHSFS